ncbi:phosphoenolpyruvate carboxylase [Escherichia coli]
MPVAPLFETLDDLNNANDVMTQLLNIFQEQIGGFPAAE